jgi:hypothetical protein
MWLVLACANLESGFLRSSMDSITGSKLLIPGGPTGCTSSLLEDVFCIRPSPARLGLIPTFWQTPSSVRSPSVVRFELLND